MGTKDTRQILDGRGALRYRGVSYKPGTEDKLQAVLSPAEMKRLQGANMISGEGWEAGAKESEDQTPRLSAQDARRQLDASRAAAAASSGSQMPYAHLLIPSPFVNEDAVDAASDAEILAVRGIGAEKLAEIREYFGQ